MVLFVITTVAGIHKEKVSEKEEEKGIVVAVGNVVVVVVDVVFAV